MAVFTGLENHCKLEEAAADGELLAKLLLRQAEQGFLSMGGCFFPGRFTGQADDIFQVFCHRVVGK